MQNDGIYQMVNGGGSDVLRVKISIVDLYIGALWMGTARGSPAYTLTAGEMSINAQLFDSQTNELLARVVDRRKARRTPNLALSNSTTSIKEARTMTARWARILRDCRDEAHEIGNS